MSPLIRKCVILAAGFGTRMLPVTKAVPKEMLPVIDRPIIHFLVEEAVAAGVTEILIISRTGKHAIDDYFNPAYASTLSAVSTDSPSPSVSSMSTSAPRAVRAMHSSTLASSWGMSRFSYCTGMTSSWVRDLSPSSLPRHTPRKNDPASHLSVSPTKKSHPTVSPSIRLSTARSARSPTCPSDHCQRQPHRASVSSVNSS